MRKVNHTFHKGKMAQTIGRRYMYLLAPVCGVLQTRSSGQFHFMICRIAWTSLSHNQVTQITIKISSHRSSLAQQLSLQHLTIMDNNPQQTSLCYLLSKSTLTAHSLKQPETMVLSPAKQCCPNTSRLLFFKTSQGRNIAYLKMDIKPASKSTEASVA
jgi:hypothetical protein